MTIAWPGDLVPDQARPLNAHPVVSSRAPGFAMAVSMPDRLRLVVLDLADRDGLAAEVLREVQLSTTGLSADELADQLVEPHLGQSRCSSVAVADLFADGTLDLQGRAAPPVVVLSAGLPPRLLLPGVVTGARRHQVGPGEVLLLCSASFLEDPPAVLATVRRSPVDDTALMKLRHALKSAPHRGATASVVGPSH